MFPVLQSYYVSKNDAMLLILSGGTSLIVSCVPCGYLIVKMPARPVFSELFLSALEGGVLKLYNILIHILYPQQC